MYDYRNIEKWLHRACAGIRFAPDRNDVQEELRAHYEDACDAMTGSGLSAEDAAELALRGMGDADELAPVLAKAHNSVWTWLWLISRWLLRIAVAVLTWFVLCYTIPGIGSLYFYEDGTLTPTNWAQENGTAVVSAGYRKEYLGYDWIIPEWSRDADTLVLELVLHDHRLTAYDPVVGLNRVDLLDQDGAAYHFMIHRSTKCLTRYEYTLVVEELPRDTEWLELQVEGSDFAMRVDLTKGVRE